MRRLLVAGVAAGLVTLVLFVGNRTSRHPGLTTRRLSDDADRHAVDACEYCERLTRDWEKRVCGILSGGADDGGSFFSDYFSGIAATATRKPQEGIDILIQTGAKPMASRLKITSSSKALKTQEVTPPSSRRA